MRSWDAIEKAAERSTAKPAVAASKFSRQTLGAQPGISSEDVGHHKTYGAGKIYFRQ